MKILNFITRCYQHVVLLLLVPLYLRKDPNTGFNCKKGFGITAKDGKKSFMHKLKHYFYDRRDLFVYLVMDERKCYDHVTIKLFRRALKQLTHDKFVIDFAVNISFLNKKLPIGTPTSPFVHHIVHLSCDIYIKQQITKNAARYADDNFLAFHSMQEANQAKWKLQNYWWYVLGVRCKTSTIEIRSFDYPLKICGYVYRRLEPDEHNHNKGICLLLNRTCQKITQCNNEKSLSSYFGMLIHADMHNYLINLSRIKNMIKLTELVEKSQLDYKWGAPPMEVDELIDNSIKFNIHHYEIRQKGDEDNYLRMYISLPAVSVNGEIKHPARVVSGNYTYLMKYLRMVEGTPELLPLVDVELERVGKLIIFKGSIQISEYLEDGSFSKDSDCLKSIRGSE